MWCSILVSCLKFDVRCLCLCYILYITIIYYILYYIILLLLYTISYTILLLYSILYYTLLLFNPISSLPFLPIIPILSPHLIYSFYNHLIHSIRVGTYLRLFIFQTIRPRMFYRSGWLRCVGFICVVFDSSFVFEV